MGKTEAARKLKNALVGPVVAMTTPFNKDLSLDLEGLKALTDLYIEGGIPNVIAAGSTGEFFSLTDEERKQVIKTVVERAKGKMTVIGCAAHSGTQLTVEMAKYCEEVGCDGVMVTPPYYTFSGFGGLKLHYQEISDAINIGIVIYFSGSVIRFPYIQGLLGERWKCPQQMIELASIPNVGAIKDASCDYAWHRDIVQGIDGPDGLAAVIGSDGLGYHVWGHLYGSRGYITGFGNIWPKVEVDFFNKLDGGDLEGAMKIVKEIDMDYLHTTKVTGKYWACVKYLLDEIGQPGGIMRPPLLDLNEEDKKNVKAMAVRTGLLKN